LTDESSNVPASNRVFHRRERNPFSFIAHCRITRGNVAFGISDQFRSKLIKFSQRIAPIAVSARAWAGYYDVTPKCVWMSLDQHCRDCWTSVCSISSLRYGAVD
jgi:hypothetical protein